MDEQHDHHSHGQTSAPKNLTFTRRYLDPNRVTFEYHTGRSNFTFDTRSGKSITQGLEQLAKKYDLDFTFGTAPHDYFIDRYALISPPPFFTCMTYLSPYNQQRTLPLKHLPPHPLRLPSPPHRPQTQQHTRLHPRLLHHQLRLPTFRPLRRPLHQKRPTHRFTLC